jgi:hypothetical protein
MSSLWRSRRSPSSGPRPEFPLGRLVNSTHLNLRTRDGTFAVAFSPALEAGHYSELLDAVADADTEIALRLTVRALAESWGHRVKFD